MISEEAKGLQMISMHRQHCIDVGSLAGYIVGTMDGPGRQFAMMLLLSVGEEECKYSRHILRTLSI